MLADFSLSEILHIFMVPCQIGVPVNDLLEIITEFENLSCKKGETFLSQNSEHLGDPAFIKYHKLLGHKFHLESIKKYNHPRCYAPCPIIVLMGQ